MKPNRDLKIGITISVLLIVFFVVGVKVANRWLTPRWEFDQEYRELLIEAVIDYPVPNDSESIQYHRIMNCGDCIGLYNIYIKMQASRGYFEDFVKYHKLWGIADLHSTDSSVLNDVEQFAYAASREPEGLLQMHNYWSDNNKNEIYDEIDWWDSDSSSIVNNFGQYYDELCNIRRNGIGMNPMDNRIVAQYHKGYIYIFIDRGG